MRRIRRVLYATEPPEEPSGGRECRHDSPKALVGFVHDRRQLRVVDHREHRARIGDRHDGAAIRFLNDDIAWKQQSDLGISAQCLDAPRTGCTRRESDIAGTQRPASF